MEPEEEHVSSHKPLFHFPGCLINRPNIPRPRKQGGGCEKVEDHMKFVNVGPCYKKEILVSVSIL